MNNTPFDEVFELLIGLAVAAAALLLVAIFFALVLSILTAPEAHACQALLAKKVPVYVHVKRTGAVCAGGQK